MRERRSGLSVVALMGMMALGAPAQMNGPAQTYGSALTQGRVLTDQVAEQIETSLNSNPHDLYARARLVGYYSARAARDPVMRGARLRQIEWLIENEPACPLLHYAAAKLQASDFAAPNGHYLELLRRTWQEQVDGHPDDVLVIENAVQSLATLDLNSDAHSQELAGYLKRLRAREPGDPEWVVYLADVYCQALARDMGQYAAPETKLFAAGIRVDLEKSEDAAVVGLTGRLLRLTLQALFRASGPNGSSQPSALLQAAADPLRAFSESLLRRAAALNPKNANWAKAVASAPPNNMAEFQASLTGILEESDLWPGGTAPTINVPPGAVQEPAEFMTRRQVPLEVTSLPPSAIGAGCSVRFNVLIGRDGRVEAVHAAGFSRLNVPFLEAERDALRQAHYQPVSVNGQPVEVVTQIEMKCPIRPKEIAAIAPDKAVKSFVPPRFNVANMSDAVGSLATSQNCARASGDLVSSPSVLRPGVFRVGFGVTAPTLLHKVEPEYSEEARKAGCEGTVVLSIEVDTDGKPSNISVLSRLGMGLDDKAVEAVRKWQFKPGY